MALRAQLRSGGTASWNCPLVFGWSSPYPTKVAQYDGRSVNARVELALWNFGIRSSRCAALEACLETAIPISQVLLQRLKANGLALSFSSALSPTLPHSYQFNGISNIERWTLRNNLNIPVDDARGRLRLTKAVLNPLVFVVQDLPADSEIYRCLESAFGVIDTGNVDEDVARILAWIHQPMVVLAVTDTRRRFLQVIKSGDGDVEDGTNTEGRLKTIRQHAPNLYRIIREKMQQRSIVGGSVSGTQATRSAGNATERRAATRAAFSSKSRPSLVLRLAPPRQCKPPEHYVSCSLRAPPSLTDFSTGASLFTKRHLSGLRV